jgi:signal transduction histidine kinase
MEQSLKTFLDFTRPARAQRRPVDMTALVRKMLGLLRGRAEKQRVEMVLDAPDDAITLTADDEQIQQVLVNLALNALDAMPRGGTLTVTVRADGAGGAEIRIQDTGSGISEDMMPRLFQPFASGKETGLGLGLVISKRILENHGGTIWAANRKEGGAEFVVRLPAG